MHNFAVSVVICTRNRCASLAKTLASIAEDPSTVPAELIVADNASTDQTAQVIAEAAARSPRPLRTIRTGARGHARVRNVGLHEVRSPICLFIDDDVTVEPNWIDVMANAFADPAVDAVGGRIVPRFRGAERPSWMADEVFFRPLTLWDNGEEPFQMSRGRYPLGANMALRMSVLPPDPFDPRFGHTGRASLGFEETELFDRLFESLTVRYEPSAVVNHWIDGDRLSFDAVRAKMFQFGVGAARYANATQPLPTYPRRVVRASRYLRRAVAERRHTRRAGLVAATAVAELRAFQDAGRHVETLLADLPRLSEWIAARI